jgi:hypothetical protein
VHFCAAQQGKSHVWFVTAKAQSERGDDGKIKAAPSGGVLMVGFPGIFERRLP